MCLGGQKPRAGDRPRFALWQRWGGGVCVWMGGFFCHLGGPAVTVPAAGQEGRGRGAALPAWRGTRRARYRTRAAFITGQGGHARTQSGIGAMS